MLQNIISYTISYTTSYTISLSLFLGFQIQFELLLLPEVNPTTLRLFGTLMMKDIIQTMSTVHPVRWLTTRRTLARFMADLPDLYDFDKLALNEALRGLPVPDSRPAPPGISLQDAIKVQYIYIHIINYNIYIYNLLYTMSYTMSYTTSYTT